MSATARANYSSPFGGEVITPNDGLNLAGGMAIRIKVGLTGGNVKVQCANGADLLLPMAANESFDLQIMKVYATDTTANPILVFR